MKEMMGETLEPWGKHRKLLEGLAWLVEQWGRRSRDVVEKRRNEMKWGNGALGFKRGFYLEFLHIRPSC